MEALMQRIFIATPYRAETAEGWERNLRYARAAMHDSIERGEAPFASHLLYPQVLADTNQEQREYGIAAGIEYLKICSALAVYEDLGKTAGMELEIRAATDTGIPVVFRSLGPRWLRSLGTNWR
jgi:hypothetical protein